MKLIRKFPAGFLWGGTAASCPGGCGSNADIDLYRCLRENIALCGEMGCRCFCLEVEWRRIFPRGDELLPREEGLRFYGLILDEMEKYGIEPILTIAGERIPPCASSGFGGWRSRRQIDFYVRYAKSLFERFGPRVKYWIGFDWTEGRETYLYPAEDTAQDAAEIRTEGGMQALHHRFVAAAMAVKLCHEMIPGSKMGCRITARQQDPDRRSSGDLQESAWQQRQELFISDVQVGGGYPFYTARMLAGLGESLGMEDEDEHLIGEYPADFLAFVSGGEEASGFRLLLNRLYERYRKPLFPEEGGWMPPCPDSRDENTEELLRIGFRKNRIESMREAVRDGVDLLGYAAGTESAPEGEEMPDSAGRRESGGDCAWKLSHEWYRQVIASNGEDLSVCSQNYPLKEEFS